MYPETRARRLPRLVVTASITMTPHMLSHNVAHPKPGRSQGRQAQGFPRQAIMKADPITAALGGLDCSNAKRALETDLNHHLGTQARSGRPHPIYCGAYNPCGYHFTKKTCLYYIQPFQTLFDEVASRPSPSSPRHARSPAKILQFAAIHNGRPRARADSLRGRVGANLKTSEALSGPA